MPAEPTRVPLAISHFCIRINVQVLTLWIGALSKFREEPALWHFLEIVFMQKFT